MIDHARRQQHGARAKIAIVGSGISGLAAAHRLQDHAQVTLFEASDYFGGHTHTVDVTLDGVRFPAGTPWQVANATLHIGPGGATPLPPGVSGPAATVGTACAGAER